MVKNVGFLATVYSPSIADQKLLDEAIVELVGSGGYENRWSGR